MSPKSPDIIPSPQYRTDEDWDNWLEQAFEERTHLEDTDEYERYNDELGCYDDDLMIDE